MLRLQSLSLKWQIPLDRSKIPAIAGYPYHGTPHIEGVVFLCSVFIPNLSTSFRPQSRFMQLSEFPSVPHAVVLETKARDHRGHRKWFRPHEIQDNSNLSNLARLLSNIQRDDINIISGCAGHDFIINHQCGFYPMLLRVFNRLRFVFLTWYCTMQSSRRKSWDRLSSIDRMSRKQNCKYLVLVLYQSHVSCDMKVKKSWVITQQVNLLSVPKRRHREMPSPHTN